MDWVCWCLEKILENIEEFVSIIKVCVCELIRWYLLFFIEISFFYIIDCLIKMNVGLIILVVVVVSVYIFVLV